MKTETKELTVNGTHEVQEMNLNTINDPKVFMHLSKVIKDHVKENKLSVSIQGNTYPLVEAWQFAGALLGIVPIITKCKRIEEEGSVTHKYGTNPVYKYKAWCELLNTKTGKIVGNAFALCTNKENKKKSFDEYAVASMAQTRAIGKAYRAMLGWVMSSVGFQATPWEEMEPVLSEPGAGEVKSEYEKFVIKALEMCNTTEQVRQLSKSCAMLHSNKDFMQNFRNKFNELNKNKSNDKA